MLNDLLVLLTAVVCIACMSSNLFGYGRYGLDGIDDLIVCHSEVADAYVHSLGALDYLFNEWLSEMIILNKSHIFCDIFVLICHIFCDLIYI